MLKESIEKQQPFTADEKTRYLGGALLQIRDN